MQRAGARSASRRFSRLWLPFVLVLGIGLAHAGVAGAVGLAWSSEVPPGSSGGSTVRADDIACPLATQCTAVDTQGEETTFDPREPSSMAPAKIDWGNALAGIACPAAAQCTAVDNHGGQFTFDPAAPGAITTSNASLVSLFDVACISASECVGVGNPQNTAVRFDPSGSPASVTLPIEERDGLKAVSCPVAAQCTAISAEDEITFDPSAPGNAQPVSIGAEGWLQGIDCPTATQCTAVEFDGREITFDPAAPSGATASPLGIATPWDVACPSIEQCTAVGEFETSTFDPQTPAGHPLVGAAGGGFASAIACPEPAQCTIVAGTEETTFDPQHVPLPVPNAAETPATPSVRTSRSRIGPISAPVSVSRGRALVPVTCIGDAACVIELTLGKSGSGASGARNVAAPVVLGWARHTIAAGKRATVAIGLSRAAVGLLRAHHGRRMPAQLLVNGRGGETLIHAKTAVRLTLRARS